VKASNAAIARALKVLGIAGMLGSFASIACISTTSGIGQAGQGCSELQADSIDSTVKVDARVRVFMQASVDLRAVAATIKVAVKKACIGIDNDLGVNDSWSALGDVDDAIHNTNNTGACDAARDRITAIMESNAGKSANFALILSHGACHADFDTQIKCEAGCETKETCDPGTVVTRCEPGQISVTCSGSCSANATCEGRSDDACGCQGSCEAECDGMCTAECSSGGPPNAAGECHGKCSGHCSGKCTGGCHNDQAVDCGASIKCKGECMGTVSDPVCETEFNPPSCTIDTSCFECCRASVSTKMKCDPPTVKLLAQTNDADVLKLVASINANLPPLVDVADQQGKIVVKGVERLVATGQVVLQEAGSLDGHSIACATAAAKVSGEASATLHASAQGGVDVGDTCRKHSK
jgi:hypothetical protein